MDISYSNADDVLYVQLSDEPVVKDLSYDGNVSVGYDAEGQLVEITILDLSSVLSTAPETDESTLVLTERESRRLHELMESAPLRSERFLAGRARYRQHLEGEEPAIDGDAYAWITRQADLLRDGTLNEIQRKRLATFFEHQAEAQRQEVEALLRRLLVDRWLVDHLAPDASIARRLRDFCAQTHKALKTSPSLREAANARLQAIWREAKMALNQSLAIRQDTVPERPETCPYTLEQVLDEATPKEATEATGSQSLVGNPSTCIKHITPVGGNIFLDLGFPPEEAERLKEESERRISAEKKNTDKYQYHSPFGEIPYDDPDRPEPRDR